VSGCLCFKKKTARAINTKIGIIQDRYYACIGPEVRGQRLTLKSELWLDLIRSCTDHFSNILWPTQNYKNTKTLVSNADLEPVDCAAVDERRKHSQSIAERIADWAHC